MLKYLSIRDFVIVDTLELEFSPGFTALTGETGAGKSILIDALSLLLGERGEAALVRSGCERAELSAEFDIAALPALQAWLVEQEFDDEGGYCLLRRTLDASGRSRAFINGRSATLQQLREAGEYLIAIHGQHAHQSLLKAAAQREMLDAQAGLAPLAARVAAAYRAWQEVHQLRQTLERDAGAMAVERELLAFQRRELQALSFNVLEWQEVQAEHARLAHAASLLEMAQFGVEVLSESDTACLTQLHALIARLRSGLEHDAALQETLVLLESAQNEVQEAVYALRHYQQRLELDPQGLQSLELRIAEVLEMARKHRCRPEELPEVLQRIEARLVELGGETDLAALREQEARLRQAYQAVAQELSGARALAAAALGAEITAAMQTLGMQGGEFAVALLPLAEGNAHGLEAVEFQVTANPGMPLRSLAKVASGGELSRISLAIQVAASRAASVPTLIFDEVDSGIGGRVAEIVGSLLRQLGRRHQVMCVTHLPQVAAQADAQWQVSKESHAGKTLSSIRRLDAAGRVEEIARMLGGVNITTTTRRHAAEMLARDG